jgi:hypothetical protein
MKRITVTLSPRFHTLSPANTSNTIPEPYSHGYLYGSSSYALVDAPYPADLQAAAKAGRQGFISR